MSTRLDRLVSLLETGSTVSIRNTAAQQIGSLVGIVELPFLLSKVAPHLKSNGWDTRTAASTALHHIVSNYSMKYGSIVSSGQTMKLEDAVAKKRAAQEAADYLNFDTVSICTVIENGSLLVASEGTEFDLQPVTGMALKDKIALQKKQLKAKIGLGNEFFDIDTMITEADFDGEANTISTSSNGQGQLNSSQRKHALDLLEMKNNQEEPEDDIDMSTLSARERNRLKRKAKIAKKSGGVVSNSGNHKPSSASNVPSPKKLKSAHFSSDANDDTNKTDAVVVKHNEDKSYQDYAVEEGEWPFASLCDLLLLDLFSPRWEIRHGAALGIREILKVSGSEAGKSKLNPAPENERLHRVWLIDASVRILCVLALDRFTDFVSDQIVAPVRETCAQVLGTLLQWCDATISLEILHKGILELTYPDSKFSSTFSGASGGGVWAIRHAGIIALKYWLAVRKDLISSVIETKVKKEGEHTIGSGNAFVAIIEGLNDANDDIRSVSASALLPVVDEICKLFSPKDVFSTIVLPLCKSLYGLDDLTSATASIMTLLGSLLSKPPICQHIYQDSNLLNTLVAQLSVFFRHTISLVRSSVLRVLLALFEQHEYASTCKISWVTSDLMSLILQNFLLEENESILLLTKTTWDQLLVFIGRIPSCKDFLQYIMEKNYLNWFTLFLTPVGVPLNAKLMVKISTSLNVSVHDHAMIKQDLSILSTETIMKGRIYGAKSVGKLLNQAMNYHVANIFISNYLEPLMMDSNAHRRLFTQLIVQELQENLSSASSILNNIRTMALQTVCQPNTLYYQEYLSHLNVIRNEISLLFTSLKQCHVNVPKLPPIPVIQHHALDIDSAEFGSIFTHTVVESLISEKYIPAFIEQTNPQHHPKLISDLRKIQTIFSKFMSYMILSESRVNAASAGVVIRLGKLPEKLGPLVKWLIQSLKFEYNADLQALQAQIFDLLIRKSCDEKRPEAITNKIVENLKPLLVENIIDTFGNVNENMTEETMVTLEKIRKLEREPVQISGKGRKKGSSNTIGNEAAVADAGAIASAAAQEEADQIEKENRMVASRGAELAIEAIFKDFGNISLQVCPVLWDFFGNHLSHFIKDSDVHEHPSLAKLSENVDFRIQVTHNLHAITLLCKYVNEASHKQLASLIPATCCLVKASNPIIRFAAANALAALASLITSTTLQWIIDKVFPLLSNGKQLNQRQGAAEVVYQLVKQLDDRILPFIIFLIVPILGRMSDPHESVRFLSTNIFAQLVKLIPLESAVPDPEGISSELVQQRKEERKFLGQLVGTEKVDLFELPVAIQAELRHYQKEGVSWLAFLSRYGLHGILCDDMGLGKTLQSICILSADHHYRTENYVKTKSPDSLPIPSLVVVPSTLGRHWVHEIGKYAPFLKMVLYTGSPYERDTIRRTWNQADVIITSYETLRSNIDYFLPIQFNYCILDEGHVIRNPKTKVSKSVKSVNAMKRLILSGTPIQNNVLELWSLFDFLMPGFLGTERQFNERFSKPILASRDAKSSSKEQEAGALALDQLHRQVLPFILRRMKEDVLHDLPPKIIQDYECELSDIQKILYSQFTNSGSVNLNENVDDPVKVKGTHTFQALQYLRKLVNHPALVLSTKHPKYDTVMKMLKERNSNLNDIEHAPKMMALKQILSDCGIGINEYDETSTVAQHRALIFCQYSSTLDIIEKQLFKNYMPSVTFMRLDGTVPNDKRHDIVTQFNADPSIDVLLLTTHVGGLGLNLTGADTVIFVEHDWNPMKDLQAMDRAHRLGQKRVVSVYRLITKDTIEENIMGLQKFKLNIASSVINEDNTGIKSIGSSQVLDLFRQDDNSGNKANKDTRDKPLSTKEVLENLGDLWDEDEYDDLKLDEFLKTLK